MIQKHKIYKATNLFYEASMIYIVGVIGFLSGFALGQFILAGMLKDKSNEELQKDSKLIFNKFH